MEICFLIDIIRSFFKEYMDPETHKAVRDLKKIAKRYLFSSFIFDFVAILYFPLKLIYESRSKEDLPLVFTSDGMNVYEDDARLLYLLRLLRIKQIFVILNTQVFQSVIKIYFRSNLNASIQRNSTRQEDNKEDNNRIMQQILIMYIFRVIRLIIFILILSYFLGTIWFIITKETSRGSRNQFTFYNSNELYDLEEQ